MKKFYTVGSLKALLLVVFYSFNSLSQTPLNHEKKVYQAENGKTYWNKYLPVYINLSPTATKESTYLLKSDTSAKYTEPYYFDTEGENFIRTRWAVNKETKRTVEPKIEVLWEVYADGLPPVSKIKFSNEKPAITDGNKYYGKDVETFISAKDVVSGLDKIYYSVNGKDYKEYTSSLKFNEEGEYILSYYGLDKVGNAETNNVEKFYIDLSSPETTVSLVGSYNENVISPKSRIGFKVADGHAGVAKTFYAFDDKKEKAYFSPLELSSLTEGEHKIKFYSIDKVNNKETEKEYSFFIDKTAPIVNADILGDRYNANGKEYFSGRAKVKLIAVDNKAGVNEIFYSINGGAFQLYDNPFYLTATGNTRIDYYATDKVGNRSSLLIDKNEKGLSSFVDLTGPELSHYFIGPTFKTRDTLFISPSTKVLIKGSDAEAGIQKLTYSLNGGEETEYNGPLTLEKEGFYTMEIYGYDNVNNSNKQTLTFTVDNAGPNIYSTFDGKSLTNKNIGDISYEVFPSHVALFLSVTDKQLGYDKIFYSINDGPEKLYTNPIHGFNKGTDYKITIKALDKLGNTTREKVQFAIAE